jgi:apolipoprotein N-acyltransferase
MDHAISTPPEPVIGAAPRVGPPPARALFWQCLLPALLSGGLLWACHFPLACGWLGWVALVPFLSLVRSTARPWKVYLSAWLGSFVFFLSALHWMPAADYRMYITWPLLALHCTFFYLAGLFLLRLLDRRTPLPLVLTVPVVWAGLEYVRAWFLGGFPWYFLAHTQHDALPLIQVADVTGQWGITFVLAAVNALLLEGLFKIAALRRLLGLSEDRRPVSATSLGVQAACVVVLVGVVVGYGLWQLGRGGFEPGPRVALVQGNIPQSVRNDSSGGDGVSGDMMLDHYDLITFVAARQQNKPDLVVWPETCYPEEWKDLAEGVSLEETPEWWRAWNTGWKQTVAESPRYWPTNVLLGVNFSLLGPDGKERRRNSVLLIRDLTVPAKASYLLGQHATAQTTLSGVPIGPLAQVVSAEAMARWWEFAKGQPDGRYDKMHLVPFGEYVPLREWLPFMDRFAPYDFDYSVQPGERQTRFRLGKYSFGAVICYEDTDPFLARQLALPDGDMPPVDFIVNATNDGWFDGLAEHEEHLALARFRAVESRRPLVRAVNMGISAVIDGNGSVLIPEPRGEYPFDARHHHVLKSVPLWEADFSTSSPPSLPTWRWSEFKKTHGVLTAVLPLDGRPSLYAAWGDWLPQACWVVVGLAVTWVVLRRLLAGA